jgi:tRNA nucleotidyltransferase (CCA-adding enzyme)
MARKLWTGVHEMKAGSVAHWEHFHHVADIGVRGSGHTLNQAFEQAALAMTAVIVDPATVAGTQAIEIAVSATDNDMLFVEWLDALIYEMATRKMLFRRFQVEIHDHGLRAEAWGEPIDMARHQPGVEIKGATLTELRVWQDQDHTWHAQCVVDV